ncbi:MAG: COX15/CtaA family protein [Pseudomonadota bacterium]
MTKERTLLKYITTFSVLFAFLVIALGAFTRLVDAGLGCPDWPGCYGHVLWPESAEEVAQANQAYPGTPVEHDKTWPEMVHRHLATTLGVLSLLIVLLAVRYRVNSGIKMTLPLLILGMIILQGMFGMWTVTLKLWPQVVTAHLLGGFATLSLFWLLRLQITHQSVEAPCQHYQRIKQLLPLLYITLFVVIMQIFLGGWTTSNYANVACPDFPTCQNQWWPAMDFKQGFNLNQHIGPNYLGGVLDNSSRVAIHMMHRLGAIVVLIMVLISGLKVLKAGVAELKPKVMALFGVLGVQIALGISNIVFDFPLFVAVAHNLIGALLLLKVISLIYAMSSITDAK